MFRNDLPVSPCRRTENRNSHVGHVRKTTPTLLYSLDFDTTHVSLPSKIQIDSIMLLRALKATL